MNRLIPLALALSLGGCVTASDLKSIVTFQVSQSQIDGARSAYDGGFLAGLHRYALLPKCSPSQTFLKNQCHNAGTLKTLRNYDKAVAQDFASVQANLDSGNTTALSAAWSVLQNAISAANTQLNQAQAN